MGVPRHELPKWDDLQIMVAQMAAKPLMEDHGVSTELVIGPEAKRPLTLKIPLFVSDMSFGALSEEAKVALARGAELSGTGTCSGEGGMLPEEQAENSRYFLRIGKCAIRLPGRAAGKGPGFSFQGWTRRENRNRRPSTRQQEQRQDITSQKHTGRTTGNITTHIQGSFYGKRISNDLPIASERLPVVYLWVSSLVQII